MRALPFAALALGLAACASRPYLPESHWQGGARAATIVAIDSPSSPLAVPPDCASLVAQARSLGQPVVQVGYRMNRSTHHMLALPDAGVPLATGAWVELWPGKCKDGHLGRLAALPSGPKP
jgi:hypothetical protein